MGVVYHRLHHFLTEAPWSATQINQRRLEVMNKCSQTKIGVGFTLILDDSGHRKSGNFTSGVGRQYIGEIGKTDNGLVVVTTHLYDGTKSLPLDIELYQHASSLPWGKEDGDFKKKPEIGIELINRSLNRKYRPKIILLDAGYGNNVNLLQELEKRHLKYLGGVARNRKIIIPNDSGGEKESRIDEFANSLSSDEFKQVTLFLDKPKTVYVSTFSARMARLEGERIFAIVMNASSFAAATDIDYFITNVAATTVTAESVVTTYSQRNWVEVFYREAKGWLGLREYQVREKQSLQRHFVLVFCAYTFILWHHLTGGLQRRWANKTLATFTDALAALRTAMSFRFFNWLTHNRDVFAAYKASLGFIWA